MPGIALAAARDDDGLEVDPRLSDELCLLVVVEHGHLQLVVVGRVVHGEAELLVPAWRQRSLVHLGDSIGDLPARRLATTAVRRRLLRLLSETGGTVRILLSHGAAVGEVLGPVDDGDQRSDDGPVDGHVRVDSSSMLNAERAGLHEFGGGHGEAGSGWGRGGRGRV